MIQEFFDAIEDIVWEKDIPYTEAILLYGEEHDIDPDTLGIMVKENQVLMTRVSEEAEKLNLVAKVARFPDDAI